MKKNPFPNRIKELRAARGLTQEQLADLTDLSVGYLSRLESGKRNLSLKNMPRIAQALGVRPSELIDASRAWVELNIFGIVTDGAEIVPLVQRGNTQNYPHGEYSKTRHKLTVDVPAALGEVIAVLVVGNSLYPRYADGDIITFIWGNENVASLLGKEAVVQLPNGKVLIKTPSPGTTPGKYHLTAFNAPPILDMEISQAAQIGIVLRA